MLSISTTDGWRNAHTGAFIGLLELAAIDNTRPSARLEEQKRETETRLRERYRGFTRQGLLAQPVMSAYHDYYKHFDKTYHVLLQVESIVFKSKVLPDVSPLVDACFAAEAETFILTAGHDGDKLKEPVRMDVSRPGDQITQMNGITKDIRAGDMVMRDAEGICCTILYGQDNRSPIASSTRHVLYVVYAPSGVPMESVELQLKRIEENVRLFCPSAAVEQHHVLKAGGT